MMFGKKKLSDYQYMYLHKQHAELQIQVHSLAAMVKLLVRHIDDMEEKITGERGTALDKIKQMYP
jgi:hypothetical protein